MLQFKLWLVFGSISLLGTGSAIAAMQIEITPKPNPPEAGENNLMVVLKDDVGKPFDNAKVDVLVFMPAMGTMPRMEEKAKVTAKGSGAYEARFDLSMGGTWEIALNAEKNGEKASAHYSITTGIPGVEKKGRGKTDSQGPADSTPLDIGPERLQMIGVRFAEAKTVVMQRNIDAVGVVEQDQTHREELTLRYSGYIVKQFRGRVGDPVKAGDPLFSVYSPDLVTAQSEFLLADRLSEGGHSLHKAAGEKLKNLGLSERDIAEIRKDQQPRRDIVVRSPIKGTILDILVREGASVGSGQVLYIIGDLSKTYIVARIFQQEVGHIKVGQQAIIVVPGSAADPIQGKVDLIYPQIEQGAGTANVRVEVNQMVSGLKPGVYVDVSIPVELGSLLSIPAEAILYSGRHRYVFVDRGEGRLEPREVRVGKSADGRVQILDGLKEGERVAASGTFLLGSEAQLRSALPKWKDEAKKTETEAASRETSTPKADMMNMHNGHRGESK